MADMNQVYQALQRAHAAGDTDNAQKLVDFIKSTQQTQNQPLDLDQPNVLQDGEGSDFFRGIGSYKDQFGGIIGGAEVLAGKAVDSDEMIMSGVERMQESEEAVNRRGVKKTDSFLGAYDEGIGAVLTEFIPYIAGQGVGMIAEALVTATAGAIVGSAAAPGFGTLSGALTGFVGRELVKEGIIDAANTLTEKERNALIRRETARIIQTDAGKQAIKELYTKAGKVTALSGMAAKFGAGETTGRAIDEAIRDIEDPQEQLAKIKELSTGKLAAISTAHALANYIGIKIGLGALEKMAAPTQNVLLNIAKNISFTGLKEAPVEAIQSGLERYGADLPLTDRAAINEYIDAAAAGFFMPIVPATIGGLRSGPVPQKPEDTEGSDSDINQDIKLTDTVDGKNLTDEEIKQKQKGWTLNTEETKRRKKLNVEQESANTDHENLDQYDSNDANIDITRRNVPQQATLPGLELTPEEQQALIATGIGGQDVQRNDGTRSAEQGELGVSVETPVLSRTEGDAKNFTEPVGVTVDTSKSNTTGTTGGEGGFNPSLTKQKGRKKVVTKKEEIKLPPINNNLSVEEEQSFEAIQKERGLTDQQLADLKETYIADRNVKLRQQAQQKFEEEQAKARRDAAARQSALDRENQQEGEEIVNIDEDVNLDIPAEQQLTIPGLEPTLTELSLIHI